MSLFYILLYRLTSELNIETSLLKEDSFYIKKLSKKILSLKELKSVNNYKKLSKINELTVENNNLENINNLSENFIVMYIISISFLKTNTIINVSDVKGNLLLFYTSGSVNLIGKKQKKRRHIAVSKLISLVIKKVDFIGNKPIALHLKNVLFHKLLIVKKIKQKFFVKIIKNFSSVSFNGCRKKKIRRRKKSKTLIR